MRVFIGVAALCVFLVSASTYAQDAPAPAPAPQAAPAPAQFPAGTKYAFVSIQRVAAESAAGKELASKVQALNQQKVGELNDKNKQLQGAQQKLEQGGSVLSPNAAAQLQKEIERLQVDIQRFTEDAQQEVTALQQQLQDEFSRRVTPVVDQIAKEKGLDLVFSAADAGLIWASLSLDLTGEVIKRLDASRPAAAAPRPAAPAAAAPGPKPAAPAPAPKPAPPAPAPKPAAPKPAN